MGKSGYQQSYADWHAYQANSAGGMSVRGIVKNHGQKAVKKYTIYFRAYNGANEMVECEASGKCIVGVCSADSVDPLCIQEFFFWIMHGITVLSVGYKSTILM